MQRSIGVTTNAIVVLIGSGLVLLCGILMIFGMALAMSSAPVEAPKEVPLPPVVLKAFMLLMPLVYILPAVWGICTGIGLLRLRNWARISLFVFASLLAVNGFFGGFGALIFTMVRLPNTPDIDPKVLILVRTIMIGMVVSQLAIGAWWLIFFNRAKVSAQFRPARIAAPFVAPPPFPMPAPSAMPSLRASSSEARPISITIIGWYLLVVCAFAPMNLLLRLPVPLFTWILTGWSAVLFLLITVAVNVYIGVGLLRLWPAARLTGMGYFAFTMLNSAVFCFAPGGSSRISRFLAAQWSMFPWMKDLQETIPIQFDFAPFIMIGLAMGIALTLVLIYFLYTNKTAFQKAKALA